MKKVFIITLLLLILGCGGSSKSNDQILPETPPTSSEKLSERLPISDNRESEQLDILMIGNSHTGSVGRLLSVIFDNVEERQSKVLTLFGTHLDDTVTKIDNINTLNDNAWSHVILQGQKYSQSQAKLYPTDAAKIWIQRIKAKTATPVLFPEHPQKGSSTEAEYVHGIHRRIANQEPSCVAPVGLAWELVLEIKPQIELHSVDGNHASELGSFLSALVIFEVITGKSADSIPYMEVFPGDEMTQDLFGLMASTAVLENLSCYES